MLARSGFDGQGRIMDIGERKEQIATKLRIEIFASLIVLVCWPSELTTANVSFHR